MSLPAILEQIRAQGEAQIREIEQRAKESAEAILAQAQLDAERIESDARNEASAPGVTERAQILHKARMGSLRMIGDARENLLGDAFTGAKAVLADVRSDPRYPGVFRTLIRESLVELASEGKHGVQIEADPRDKSLLEQTLIDLDVTLPVSFTLACWGGVTANSMDGKVVVINTMESRLERITPFLRGHLAAFFEQPAEADRPHG